MQFDNKNAYAFIDRETSAYSEKNGRNQFKARSTSYFSRLDNARKKSPVTPQELLAQSKKRIQVSDHFLTQTYPLVQDPKLLVNILDGILKAVEDMVDAMLQYERAQGRVPAYHEGNFTAKLALIRGEVAKRYNFGHIDIAMITEMQELLHQHKQSAVEFARRGQFVIASNDYRLSTVSVEKIKTYLVRAKSLHTKVNDTITS